MGRYECHPAGVYSLSTRFEYHSMLIFAQMNQFHVGIESKYFHKPWFIFGPIDAVPVLSAGEAGS